MLGSVNFSAKKAPVVTERRVEAFAALIYESIKRMKSTEQITINKGTN